MAGNKHALTRYRVLDACFSNSMKKYYAEDLIKKCNEALAERYGSSEVGISRRTFFDDLNDLDNIVGEYGVEVLRRNDGRKKFYRYSEEGFSLFAKGFTEDELVSLKETIQTLQRFKGLPSFQWMTTLVDKLEEKMSIKHAVSDILSYEENADYVGIDWLKDIFDAIVNQQPLRVSYRSFDEKEFNWIIHPYYIKQFNNRWFLLGMNPVFDRLSNLPLDRIENIEPVHLPCIPNTSIDFESYFDNIIGVTITDAPIEVVKLKFTPKRLQYVLTKPIHKSQVCRNPNSGIVELKLIPNNELVSTILYFGSDVEVIEPISLRKQVSERVRKTFEMYFAVQAGCTTMPYLCSNQ